MIRCYNCQHFLSACCTMGMPRKQYDSVPDEVVDILFARNCRCNAFPDGIPKEMFYIQNSRDDRLYDYCNNGYSYRSGGPLSEEQIQQRAVSDEKLTKIIKSIIEYTEEDFRIFRRIPFPWEDCQMRFFKISPPPRKNLHAYANEQYDSVYKCIYQGEIILFGVGLPIPIVTDDMLNNGEWFVYTWSD